MVNWVLESECVKGRRTISDIEIVSQHVENSNKYSKQREVAMTLEL